MNLQPTIFISSIISEFYDLRGALRYFLNKSGFRVLMSEESDFGADCNEDSLINCKTRIDHSDYYLLIIGTKPGFIFKLSDDIETSVTFEEFKHFINTNKSRKINLLAFVRKQAWEYYNQKDYENMPKIQHEFINDLVNNSLLDNQLGRWRYTFDKFQDIVNVLETHQNGLFIEASRKKGIYREYIKRELTQILKTLLISDKDGKGIKTLKDTLNIPDLSFQDYLKKEKISPEIAIHIITFIQSYQYKEEVLIKTNRVFNYISQGEFSFFNAENETYELPEYIKSTIQTLEILERVLINFKRGDLYKNIATMNEDNLFLNKFEYGIIEGQLTDINIVTRKLISLMQCLYNNWVDFKKMDDTFYEYRGNYTDDITTSELVEFSNAYYKKGN